MTIDARHPLPGERPLVVGAARSGLAAARLLSRLGLRVRVCDRRAPAELPEAARELERMGAEAWWGRDLPEALEGRDFVVWSPGIDAGHPIAKAAAARGIPVLSELEIGYLAAHGSLICITGTNGKSTTTDLAGALLAAGGREVRVCGNIGRPICDVALDVGPSGFLVVEVSSFQLETVTRLEPYVAVWLNLTADHLDRHDSFEHYATTKQRLFARQDDGDYAVWNADDAELSNWRTGKAMVLEFSRLGTVAEGAYVEKDSIALAWRGGRERLMPVSALRIPGPHNLSNALAGLAATLPLEIPRPALRDALAAYPGLEHRLEPVATVDGVRFVNDSKATNADSLAVALESFDHPVVLIAGGRDKGQDFTPLAAEVGRAAKLVVLIGEGAERMAAAWPGVPTARAASLAEAVRLAYEAAKPAGTALLSPGCASFDMFRDYEARGAAFKAEVHKLAHEEAAA